MTHVFVAPHPDDVALSCGGLIASLRELGQNVTILTVYLGRRRGRAPVAVPARGARVRVEGACGRSTEAFNRSDIAADWPTAALVPAWAATEEGLEATQSDADAAAKRFWQRSSWYRRASIRNVSLADQAVIDESPTQGAVLHRRGRRAAAAGDLMARRRVEDERYAYFAEASVVFLDLPDAVFRGYEGDDRAARRAARGRRRTVRAAARRDRPARAAAGLLPARRRRPRRPPALPGGRASGCSRKPPLGDARTRTTPGSSAFYEDFPYALVERLPRPRRPRRGPVRRRCRPTSA